MKVYKNFDEIRGKVKKTIKKVLRKFKKNRSIFKYFSIILMNFWFPVQLQQRNFA